MTEYTVFETKPSKPLHLL